MLESLAASGLNAFASGLGQGMGGPNVSGGPVTSWVDGSGWTVATGSAMASGALRSDSALGAAALDNSALLWVGAAVVLFLAWRKAGR